MVTLKSALAARARGRSLLYTTASLTALIGSGAHAQTSPQTVVTAAAPGTVVTPATGPALVVTSADVRGTVALNRFGDFRVATPDTVTMVLPTGTSHLVNLVDSAAGIRVDGTVTARLGNANGAVGGHLLFAAPGGIVIGNGAKVYAGRVSLVSGSASAFDAAYGAADPVAGFLSADIAGGKSITVDGSIFAPGGVAMRAPSVTIGKAGVISVGAGTSGAFVAAGHVQTGGVADADRIIVGGDGTVDLVADTVRVEGDGAAGGRIDAQTLSYRDASDTPRVTTGGVRIAAADVALLAGSRVEAQGGAVRIAAAQTAKPEGVIDTLTRMPSATAKVVLDGFIEARSIDVTARATATTAADGFSMPALAADFLGLGSAYAGLQAAVAKVAATSTIAVGASASLTARDGNLSLAATSDATAEAKADSLATTGTAPLEFGFVYAQLDSNASVSVAGRLAASGDLALSATNRATTEAEALTYGRGVSGLSAVVARETVSANLDVAATGRLDAGGALRATAYNQEAFDAKAASYEVKGKDDVPPGAAGGAIVVALREIDATATLGGTIGGVLAPSSIALTAGSDSTHDVVEAATRIGDPPRKVEAQALVESAFPNLLQGLYDTFAGSKATKNSISDQAKPTDNLAAAVTLELTTQAASATIAPGAVVTGGAIDVSAKTRDGIDLGDGDLNDGAVKNAATAQAAVKRQQGSSDASVSVAIAVGIKEYGAHATVGENAAIVADTVGVTADIARDYSAIGLVTIPDLDTDGAEAYAEDAAQGLFTNQASASAGDANGNGYAGSVGFNAIDAEARAWIDSGARLTLGADRAGRDALAVSATTLIEATQLLGKLKAGAVAEGGDKAGGGALGVTLFTPVTIAGIADGVAVSTAGTVRVAADATLASLNLATLSGKGAGIGVAGTFGSNVVIGATHATISNAATIDAAAVSVDAASHLDLWSTAGALGVSSGGGTQDTQGSVGVSGAANVVELDTLAAIAANGGDDATGVRSTTRGHIAADDVSVTSLTNGRIGTLTVAGAYSGSSSDSSPGTFSKLKAKAKTAQDKVDSLPQSILSGLALLTGQQRDKQGDIGGSGTPPSGAPTTGFGIAGSSSVTFTDVDTRAVVRDGTVTKHAAQGSGLKIAAAGDVDLYSVSGSGAISRAKAASAKTSTALAGAIGVQFTDNQVAAGLSDSHVSGQRDVTVLAVTRGDRIAAGLGLAASFDATTVQSRALAASVTYSETRDSAAATIDGGDITGMGNAGALRVGALNSVAMGLGSGSISYGGKQGLGVAVTIAQASGGANASVTDAAIRDFDAATVLARNAAQIVSLGAAIAITDRSEATQFVGAGVANIVDMDAIATLDTARGVTVGGAVNVVAGGSDPIDWLGLSARASGAQNGADDYLVTREELELGDGDGDFDSAIGLGKAAFNPGARVLGIAGTVGASKSADATSAGVNIAYNAIDNDSRAAITGPGVLSAGRVTVASGDAADILSAAVGAAVSGGNAAMGSLTVNRITGTVAAAIGAADVTTGAGGVSVTAAATGSILSLAGQFVKGRNAFGASVAYNELVRDGGQGSGVTADLAGTRIATPGNVLIGATSDAIIRSAAAAGALASEGAALSGAATGNIIQTDVAARATDSDIDAGRVALDAKTTGKIDSLALGVALASGNGGGVGVAVNRIDPTVVASLSRSTVAAADVSVAALAHSGIRTLAAGIGKGELAGAGSVVLNLMDADVTAEIADDSSVVTTGTTAVAAEDLGTVDALAGSVAYSASGGAAGITSTINKLAGSTVARVVGSTVAAGNAGEGARVNSGVLASPIAQSNSLEAFANGDMSQTQTRVNGVAVNAASGKRVRVAGGAAAFGTVGIGASLGVNLIAGETRATLDGSAVTATGGADVDVRASSNTAGVTAIASLAGGSGGAVAGAGNAEVYATKTEAVMRGGSVRADRLNVQAIAQQTIGSLAAGGGGGGGSAAGLAGVGMNLGALTSARVDGGATIDTAALAVDARNTIGLIGGALGVAVASGVAGGASVVAILNDGVVEAIVGGTDRGGAANAANVTSGDVTVHATADTDVGLYGAAGGVALGGGAAGTGLAVVQKNATHATIQDAAIRSTGDVDVLADEYFKLNAISGALGVGVAGGGLGLGVTVLSVQSDVAAQTIGSTITARTLDILARGDAAVDSQAWTVALGTVALSANAIYLQFGQSADSNAFFTDRTIGGTGSDNRSLTAIGNRAPTGDVASADLSAADRAAMGKVGGTAAAVKGATAHRVVAGVTGASTITADAVTVDSAQGLRTLTRAGNVAGGALVAAAGTVDLIRTYSNVGATVGSGASVTAGALTIRAGADEYLPGETGETAGDLTIAYPGGPRRAAEGYSVLGTAGFAAGNVGYVDAKLENTISASFEGVAHGRGGALNVSAHDATDAGATTLGLTAAVVALNGSVARASRDTTTAASLSGRVDGFATIDVAATDTGRVDALSVAGTGGVFGATAAYSEATNATDVSARLGASANIANGATKLTATVTPLIDAEALGVTVGAVALGASIAKAEQKGTVAATVDAGATILGALTIDANLSTVAIDAPMVTASAIAGAGGALVGAVGTSASAINSTQVIASVGAAGAAPVNLGTGALSIKAFRGSVVSADAAGLAVGIVGVGANFANADGTGSVGATLGAADGSDRGDSDLTIAANAGGTVRAHAVAGSGGVVAGAGADARTTDRTITTARFAATPVDGQAFMAGTVKIEANSAANAYGSADTHESSVAGKSGAVVRNTIGTTTLAEMIEGAQLGARKVDIDARANTATGPAGAYMIDGGSGGVFNDAAASARNDVSAIVVARVGDAARIVQRNAAGVDTFAEGRGVSIDASNVHVGDAKVRLDAGSFIASPRAELTNTVTLTTNTLIGDGAWIDAQQSIGVGNVARTSLDADAYSKVSGAAGYVEGAAYNTVTAKQTTDIGDGAWIESLGDVRIGAGTGSDGADKNGFAARAEAQVYNWTFAALRTDADATSYGTSTNDLSLGTASTIRSGRDVKLFADRDSGDFTGHYEEQSTYLKVADFFSDLIDTVFGTNIGFSSLGTGGDGKLTGNGALRLLGDVEVTAGMLAKRSLNVTGSDVFASGIDLDGSTQSVWDDAAVRLDGNLKYLFADRIAMLKNRARTPEEDYMLSSLDIDDARNTTVSALFAQSGNLDITAPVIAASGAQNHIAANRANVSISESRGFNLVVGGVTIPDHDGGLIRWSGGTTLPATALTATQDSADGRAALTIVSGPSYRSNVLIGGAIAGTSTDYHVTVANGDYLQFAGVDVRSYGADIPKGVFFAQLNTPFQQNNPIDGWKSVGISLRDGPNKLGAAEAANIVAYQDYFRSAYNNKQTGGTNNDLQERVSVFYLYNDQPGTNQDAVLGTNTIRVWGDNYKTGWGPVYPGDRQGEQRNGGTSDDYGIRLHYLPGGVADFFRRVTLPTKLFGSLGAANASSLFKANVGRFQLTGAAPTAATLPDSAVIKANALYVNAPYINLSGRVELGRSSDYTITIPIALDFAMEQIARALRVETGTAVRVKDYRSYLANAGFPVGTFDTPGSLLGDVRYVVGENRFIVDDITTGVAGRANFYGSIVNTNSAGTAQITVNDGQGAIAIQNNTSATVTLNTLSTSSVESAYVDFNGNRLLRGANGALVATSAGCVGAICESVPTVTGASTAILTPANTLRFRWTDTGIASRQFNYVNGPQAGTVDLYKSSYTPWTWESITLATSGIFAHLTAAEAAAERVAGTAWSQEIGGTLTDRKTIKDYDGTPNYYPVGMLWEFPTKIGLSVQTTIRADYPIGVSFIGNPVGKLDVKSSGTLQFDGAINNPTGLTTIAGVGLGFGSAASIISGSLSISNTRGSIGAIDAPLAVKLADGGVLRAAASDWYARPADIAIATKGNTVVHSSYATGDVYLISQEGSLLGDPAAANGISGNNITLLAPLGSVGTLAKPVVMSYSYGRDYYYDPDAPFQTGGGSHDSSNPDAVGVLGASARDGIAITSAGHMRVGLVSAPGAPILLRSIGGDIVSARAEEVFDPQAVARLAGAYDALKLRGSDADEANARVLTAFTNGFARDQAEYRLLSAGLSGDSTVRGAVAAQALAAVSADIALLNDVRAKAKVAAGIVTLDDAQAEGFREFARLRLGRSEDAGSALSTSQITAAVQGYYTEVGARVTAVIGRPAINVPGRLSTAQVDAFAQTRIAALEASFTDLFGATKPFTANGPEYVLDVKTDTNLRPVEFTRRDGTTGVQSRYDSLVQGATWRDAWLDVRIPGDALVPVASTRLVNAAPNIVGGDITLIAQGNVGAFSPSIGIHYTGDSALLTDIEKAVIAAAGPGDITIAAGANNSIDFTVQRERLLQIESSGTLNVATQGRAFVGANGDLPIGTIVAGNATNGGQAANDVRLVSSGSITATRGDAGAYDIVGGALRIEAGDGSIGTADRPIVIAVDRLESARAAGNLSLAAVDTMRVGNVFAGGALSLTSTLGAIESIFDSAVVHIQANGGAAIHAGAGIGSAARPLQLAGGSYTLGSDYAGIYANAPTGSLDIVGPRFASDERFGIVSLGAAQNLKLTLEGDQRSLYRLDLTAGSGLTLGGNADLGLAIVTARAGDSLRTTGTLYLDQFDFAGLGGAKPTVTIDGSLTMPYFALRNVGDVRINGVASGLYGFAIDADGAFSTGRTAKLHVVGDDDYGSGITADTIEFAPTSLLDVAAGDAFRLDSRGLLNLGLTTGAGAIVAKGDDIAVRGRILNGAFAADAAGTLTVGADVRSGGTVSLEGTTIAVAGDRVIAGESVGLTSASSLDTRGYHLRGGSGGVALTSDGLITASRIATPGTLTVRGSDITLGGPMAVGGIDAAGTDVIRIDGRLYAASSLTLAAPAFSIASGSVLVSDRIALSSPNAIDTTSYLLRGGAGGVSIDSGGLLTLGQVGTPGVLTLRGDDIVSTINLSLGGVDAVASNAIALRRSLLVAAGASLAARDFTIGAFREVAARDLKIVTDGAIDGRINNLSATNILSLTSLDAVTVGALTLTGNLTLRGREIALLGDLSVGGLDALTAGTLAITDGITLSGRTLSLDSGGAIDATRATIADGWHGLSLRSAGDVAIGATRGIGALQLRGANLGLTGNVSAGSIDAETAGVATVSGDLRATDALRLYAGSLVVADNRVLDGRSIDISSGSAIDAFRFRLSGGAQAVTLRSLGDLSVGTLASNGAMVLRGANVLLGGAIYGAALDIAATGALAFAGDLAAVQGVRLHGTTISASRPLRLWGSAVTITGDALNASGAAINGRDGVDITTTAALAIGNVTTDALLQLRGAAITTGALTAGTLDLVGTGNVTIGAIDVRDDATLWGTAVTLNGTARARSIGIDGGPLTAGDIATTGGDTRIMSFGDIVAGAITASGAANVRGAALSLGTVRGQSVDLEAASALTLLGDVTARDLLEIDGQSLSVASGKTLTGSDVTIRVGTLDAADATIATTGYDLLTITTPGRLAIGTIETDSDIALTGGEVSIGAFDTWGDVTIQGGSSVSIGDGRTLHDLSITGASVSASSLVGFRVTIDGFGGPVQIGALDAEIARLSGGAVTLGTFGVIDTSGSLKVTTSGDFAVQPFGALNGYRIDISARSILALDAHINADYARLDAMDALYLGFLSAGQARLRAGGGAHRFFIPGLYSNNYTISYDGVPLAPLIN